MVQLDYTPEALHIKAKDDGKGFNIEDTEKGAGLINMKSRAELIHAQLELWSKPNEGVELTLVYPYK